MGDQYGSQTLGKIVIDFSQKYMSIYLCEGDGTVKDCDHFKFPFRLEVKDVRHETRDCFDFFYDYCNETVNGDELQEDGEGGADSEEHTGDAK